MFLLIFAMLGYNISMNELVKRGFGVYKIFLKNKIASSIMMLFSGFMMFIAGINGYGNDTKSLPMLITSIGVVLTLWSAFRLGYFKAVFDGIAKENQVERRAELKIIFLHIAESLIYIAVAGVGVFLLSNEGFTNKALNLMTGGFTTLNGVLGAIKAFKNHDEIDFRFKLGVVLTVVELALGIFFIFASDSIETFWYVIMGGVTTVAGVIEVIAAMTHENIESTIDDGKKIIQIIKDEKETDKTPDEVE